MKAKVTIYMGGIFMYLCLLQAQELNINDQCPEVTLKVINYDHDKINLSDFRGKLLILDFWMTSCAPCIKAMPYLDSLQQVFGDKVQILPVTMEPYEKVSRFWKGNKNTKDTSLPSVVNDTSLRKLFPHIANPYEVWIDQTGRVIAFTGHEAVTAQNIRDVLSGEAGDWKGISGLRTNSEFAIGQALLKASNDNNPATIFYSALSPYIPGVRSITNMYHDTLNRTKRYTEINLPFSSFIRRCLGETTMQGLLSRVLFEVQDSTLFFNVNNEYEDEWVSKSTYCYELVIPDTVSYNSVMNHLKTDMERYMGLTTRLENRMADCWVLFRTGTDVKKLWGDERNSSYKVDEYSNRLSKEHIVTYHSIRELMQVLSSTFNSTPVIDETGYDQPIRIPLLFADNTGKIIIRSVADIPAIRKQLKQFGLSLRKEKRVTSVLIVSQR